MEFVDEVATKHYHLTMYTYRGMSSFICYIDKLSMILWRIYSWKHNDIDFGIYTYHMIINYILLCNIFAFKLHLNETEK